MANRPDGSAACSRPAPSLLPSGSCPPASGLGAVLGREDATDRASESPAVPRSRRQPGTRAPVPGFAQIVEFQGS